MEQIRKLLEQICIRNQQNAKNAEKLDATGKRFNIFRVCGVNHYENINSSILAEFLNPDGSHALKSKLLECFVKTLGDKLKVKNFDCTNAHVCREHSVGEGRIDILIEDNRNHALIIENKIYASDQREQLQRYNIFAEKKYGKGNYQILYLTLFGKNASEQSGGSIDYTSVSYKTDIIDWLEQCVSIAEQYSIVCETLKQYINHLKQLTLQDMDTKNKEEIIDMILNDRQLMESAFYFHKNNIGSECLRKKQTDIDNNINCDMKRIADELGLEYEKDSGIIDNEAAFIFLKEEWKKNDCCILFWFDQGSVERGRYDLSVGVSRYSKEGRIDKGTFKNGLIDHLANFDIKNHTHSCDAPYWAWFIRYDFDLLDIPENLSYDTIKEIVKSLAEKLDEFKG
jgi:hypothetical protein